MVRAILFRGTITGRGIVNYDGREHKWTLKKYKYDEWGSALRFDNVKVAKHAIVKTGHDGNGKPQYDVRLKISSNCLRNAIFKDDHPFQNSMILHSKKLLNMSIASVAGLLRGYMFEQEGFAGLKRKSPVIITDAEQITGGVSTLDIHTTSGAKKTKESEDDASDTSLFYKETVGDVGYAFKGVINLSDLQFIPMSDRFDRMAVNPDDFAGLYKPYLEKALGTAVAEPGFYLMATAVNALPEEGILLSPAQSAFLVGEFFKRLLSMTITRNASGLASLSGLEMKIVRNPLKDRMDDEAGWISVTTPEEIQLNPHDIFVAYNRISKEEAASLMGDIAAEMAKAQEVKKESREKKARAKKEKKNGTEGPTD